MSIKHPNHTALVNIHVHEHEHHHHEWWSQLVWRSDAVPQRHSVCRCLSTVNATRSFPHSQAEYNSMSLATEREYQVGFFNTLLSTASCSTNATPPRILHPALQELDVISCADGHGMAVGGCLLAESVTILPVTLPFLPEVSFIALFAIHGTPLIRRMFDVDTHTYTCTLTRSWCNRYACFAAPDCRPYLDAVYSSDGNGNKAEALRSLAGSTSTIGNTILVDLANRCDASFPECTFNKQQCANSSECLRCLATFDTGDSAGAARQCSGNTSSAVYVDKVVTSTCSADNAVVCEFWFQRCQL